MEKSLSNQDAINFAEIENSIHTGTMFITAAIFYCVYCDLLECVFLNQPVKPKAISTFVDNKNDY